jgi:hypothetical protein
MANVMLSTAEIGKAHLVAGEAIPPNSCFVLRSRVLQSSLTGLWISSKVLRIPREIKRIRIQVVSQFRDLAKTKARNREGR